MHNTVFSGTVVGVEGLVVEVEVDIARGIPCFSIVGLPNTAVRESRERVTAAVKNSGWDFPLDRITVNLAPADLRKEGSAFDLAIAAGVLASSGQVNIDVDTGNIPPSRTLFLGELALDGSLRRIRGALPVLLHARERGFPRAIIPMENFDEARIVEGIEVVGCATLRDAVSVVFGRESVVDEGDDAFEDTTRVKAADEVAIVSSAGTDETLDMTDVIGQEAVKRALLVAAAGGHHVLIAGPPGAGKTMLARRFATILPPLDRAGSVETTMIYSSVGLLGGRGIITTRPFRAPHHSASDAGLIGGGANPRPGEVTLAHNGVLFLDELPEFRRHVLETLREPLEDGRITIARARTSLTFPARFQLIAAMNPCPCGYHGSPVHPCRCGPIQIENYVGKISGPLLDRIAIHVAVHPVDTDALGEGRQGTSSEELRERVRLARGRQRARANGTGESNDAGLNATLTEGQMRRHCRMDDKAEALLLRAQKQLRFSARARAHIVRVSRTIADLAGTDTIDVEHVGEAIQYRSRT